MSYEKLFAMSFAKLYPMYVQKAERKGRSEQEVLSIITWLFGYQAAQVQQTLASETTVGEFIEQAPEMNANAHLITGVVCGIKVQDIHEPMEQKIRYLDKLVDELAKGKALSKILRQA